MVRRGRAGRALARSRLLGRGASRLRELGALSNLKIQVCWCVHGGGRRSRGPPTVGWCGGANADAWPETSPRSNSDEHLVEL